MSYTLCKLVKKTDRLTVFVTVGGWQSIQIGTVTKTKILKVFSFYTQQDITSECLETHGAC